MPATAREKRGTYHTRGPGMRCPPPSGEVGTHCTTSRNSLRNEALQGTRPYFVQLDERRHHVVLVQGPEQPSTKLESQGHAKDVPWEDETLVHLPPPLLSAAPPMGHSALKA